MQPRIGDKILSYLLGSSQISKIVLGLEISKGFEYIILINILASMP